MQLEVTGTDTTHLYGYGEAEIMYDGIMQEVNACFSTEANEPWAYLLIPHSAVTEVRLSPRRMQYDDREFTCLVSFFALSFGKSTFVKFFKFKD